MLDSALQNYAVLNASFITSPELATNYSIILSVLYTSYLRDERRKPSIATNETGKWESKQTAPEFRYLNNLSLICSVSYSPLLK